LLRRWAGPKIAHVAPVADRPPLRFSLSWRLSIRASAHLQPILVTADHRALSNGDCCFSARAFPAALLSYQSHHPAFENLSVAAIVQQKICQPKNTAGNANRDNPLIWGPPTFS
jgi:hypothetical protein